MNQASMEWHPMMLHCQDHGEVVHWATSKWETHGPWSPQVVDPRCSKGVILQQNVTKWLGCFTIEWDGLQQLKRKNTHKDYKIYIYLYKSMTRITTPSKPTVWHKFHQPTHLFSAKKIHVPWPSNNCIFPGFWSQEVTTYCGEVSKFGAMATIFGSLRSVPVWIFWARSKRCISHHGWWIHQPAWPKYFRKHKLWGAYDAPPP